MQHNANKDGRWAARLGWFILIWATGVASMGVLASGMRLLMHAAGLTAG